MSQLEGNTDHAPTTPQTITGNTGTALEQSLHAAITKGAFGVEGKNALAGLDTHIAHADPQEIFHRILSFILTLASGINHQRPQQRPAESSQSVVDTLTNPERDALANFRSAYVKSEHTLTIDQHIANKEQAFLLITRQIDGTDITNRGMLELADAREALQEEIRNLKNMRRKREDQCDRLNQAMETAYDSLRIPHEDRYVHLRLLPSMHVGILKGDLGWDDRHISASGNKRDLVWNMGGSMNVTVMLRPTDMGLNEYELVDIKNKQ